MHALIMYCHHVPHQILVATLSGFNIQSLYLHCLLRRSGIEVGPDNEQGSAACELIASRSCFWAI